MELTSNSEPPVLYREWTAVSTIAAVLQRKVYMNWEKMTYPNLYVVLVGPSGKCRKGTAMGLGMRFLKKTGVKMAAEAITREALIRELKNSGTMSEIPSTKKTMFHASLTIYSQELTVFLGYNNQKLMADLSDWYDCRDEWTYRTKNMGEDEIQGVWVNLIGATTPELIRSTLPQDAIGGGLTSRIIFVYEQDKAQRVVFPFLNKREIGLEDDLLYDLEDIYMMKGQFKPSESFMSYWEQWYPMQDENPPFKDPKFSGYNSRRAMHALKLSMIMSASRSSDMVVTAEDLAFAIDLLERTEVKMPLTFSGFGTSQSAGVAANVMSYIANMEKVDYQVLLNRFLGDIGTSDNLDLLLETFEAMDFCRVIYGENGTRIEYTPEKYEQIDERAAKSLHSPQRNGEGDGRKDSSTTSGSE